MKPARLRPSAKQDLSDAATYYAEQAGLKLAEDFMREATVALSRIEALPGLGSPRMAQLCGVEGLRAWPLKRFPVRWYYFERDIFLDVVRLLGDRQDIAAILAAHDMPEA